MHAVHMECKSHMPQMHSSVELEVAEGRVGQGGRGDKRRKDFVQNTFSLFFPVLLGCIIAVWVSRALGEELRRMGS